MSSTQHNLATMVSDQPTANRITINSAEYDDLIESVTVFRSNRAEIKRRVNLDLKKGQNHIRIERLPSGVHEDSIRVDGTGTAVIFDPPSWRYQSGVHEDSIRVDGTGTAVIFDVVYHAPSHVKTYPFKSHLAGAILDLQRALEALQKERSIAQEQSEFLGNYGRTLDSKSINIEDVQRFLDMFSPRQLAVAKKIQELDSQIENARKELGEAQRKEYADSRGAQRGTAITVTRFLDMFSPRQLAVAKKIRELDSQIGNARKELGEAQREEYADSRGAQRGTAITVTVLAETDGSAELTLTYVVSNASWKPLYDVRASIAKSPEGTSTIALHYRASITQTTGENWPDVALSLSTASPQLGSSVPKLSPWRIGFPAPLSISPSIQRSPPVRRTIPYSMDRVMGAFPSGGMAVRQAHVESTGLLNTTFGIPGRSDIPSDEGSHKVVIAVLELQADLEWICVPREKESVFLTCKVVNSSEFTLLPGQASVFMDDNFVSKSQIEHVSPNESFKTSLGADSALRVTYPSAKTLNRKTVQSGFLFMAKEQQSVSAQSQRITIRNTRPASVSVRVLDHVPVSTDAGLKVNVLSPSGLETTAPNENGDEGKRKENPWKDIQRGVKARWAALAAGGEGTVEWACDIAPSDEAELELSWEVAAPAGREWRKL
ncbi:hypothetical protein RSAG8_12588, partial [Rhizoctonia solani AG-8 WAC10335]